MQAHSRPLHFFGCSSILLTCSKTSATMAHLMVMTMMMMKLNDMQQGDASQLRSQKHMHPAMPCVMKMNIPGCRFKL